MYATFGILEVSDRYTSFTRRDAACVKRFEALLAEIQSYFLKTKVPEILPPIEVKEVKPEDLSALGVLAPVPKTDAPVVATENEVIEGEELPPLPLQAQLQPQMQQPQQQMMVPMMVLASSGQGMQVPMMMPQQQPMYSAAPGAPPLLVVDTSEQAMEASGFTQPGFSMPPKTANNQTRRSGNRGVRFQEPQPQQQQQSQPNVRVTINKLG